jgi:Tol biopolymer transport system component
MAPEQLEGREADARTDLFAFGAVLYEMFTGRKTFEGKSQASLIGAIMHVDPPALSASQPLTPPLLDRIVTKCLAKDPDERWQTARDVASQLRWISEVAAQGQNFPEASAAAARSTTRRRVATASMLTMAAAIAIGFTLWRGRSIASATSAPAIRASVLPPEGITITGLNPPIRLALSPDGHWLAFVGMGKDRIKRLFVRALESSNARVIEGSENAFAPFWSPDSRFVAFFAAGKLKKVALSGGSPLPICDVPGITAGDTRVSNLGGTWSPSGVIVFGGALGFGGGRLFQVGPDGHPTALKNDGAFFPFFLPDGRHFLYRGRLSTGFGIFVGQTDSSDSRVVLEAPASQAMFSGGYLMYVRDQVLLAQRFDPDRFELTGEALPLANSVLTGSGGLSAFTVSAAEQVAYQAGSEEGGPSRLVWFDRAGRQVGSIGEEAGYTSVSLSSDGTRLIAGLYPPGSITDDFWLFDLTRGVSMRFTSTREHETTAVWSPDDKEVVFGQVGTVNGREVLLKRSSDLRGEPTPLLEHLGPVITPMSWSGDGKFLLYTARSGVSIVPFDGDRKPIPLALPSVARAQLSPDGEWVAYDSRESGLAEVYVAPLPGHSGGRIKASVDGGGWPRWSRNGKELFFLSNDNRLMVVAVHGQGSKLELALPRALFEVQHKNFAYGWPYDVSPDGRILVNVRSEQVPPVTLLVNWPVLLKK